jgi:hypothetical protein
VDFARQVAERNRAMRPQKKFKTSDPKGAQLASGYIDRARAREDLTADDREQRIKALEEALKKEEIDQATFDKLRTEIAGGDLESTHLVKGLDFKLLERIRKGEDVYAEKKPDAKPAEPEAEVDVDDEFDKLEEQEITAVEKTKTEKKKGQLSTVALAPGKKRTRDQILAELKASREAAKAKQEPALGDRFRKIGAKQMPGTRLERDSKGREVLIIVDEDGHEKRKVRKVQASQAGDDTTNGLLMPDKAAKPLGMEVPEQYRPKETPEEDDADIDIFDGVGDDYDPLAGMDASGSDSDTDEEKEESVSKDNSKAGDMPPPPKPAAAQPRNYFKDSKQGLLSEEATKTPSMSDPAIMAAIKKAAALHPVEKEGSDSEDDGREKEKALEERRKRLLQRTDRDDDDIDMGFGTSRFEDEEDFNEEKVKLSVWGKDDGGEGGQRGGPSKRKRGPKKRKGDVNNADDVLRVMEQRKKS